MNSSQKINKGQIDDFISNTTQAALDSKVGGTGTINTVSKWTAAGVQGNSSITDSGTGVGGRVDVNNFIGGTIVKTLPVGNTFIGQAFDIKGTDATSRLINKYDFELQEDGFSTNTQNAIEYQFSITKSTNQLGNYGNGIFTFIQNGTGSVNNISNVSSNLSTLASGTIGTLSYYTAQSFAIANTGLLGTSIGFNYLNSPQNVTNSYGVVVGDLFGTALSRGIDLRVTAGTGKYNIYAGGTASNYLRGNLLINTTFDAGERLQIDGLVRQFGTLNANLGVSRAHYIMPTLVATANNDVLVGLDINPTFTAGAFTGVQNVGIRTNALILPTTNNTVDIGTNVINFRDIYCRGILGNNGLYFDTTNNSEMLFQINNTNRAKFYATTGNFALQNGGTFTDNGVDRLQVTGSVNINGGLKLPIKTVSATVSATKDDYTILCDATSAAITVNLPTAASTTGLILNIKKINNTSNNITIDPSGAELVDFAATFTLSTYLQNVMIQSNGTGWFIIN